MTEEEIKEEKSKYTRKIYTPIYEPQGTKPSIKDLYVTDKRDELVKEIEEDDELDDELRNFLLISAERHVSFDFAKIAEYYAHLPVKFKHHFENSALVIIDFDKAIRNGFIAYQKEVDISREDYLENILTEEKMIEVKTKSQEKKFKQAKDELEFFKTKKKPKDFLDDEEW